jgi:hypothetical protein
MKESDLAKKIIAISPLERDIQNAKSHLVDLKKHLDVFERRVDAEVERYYPIKTVPVSLLDSLPTNK